MKQWRNSITATIAATVIVSMIVGFMLQQVVSVGEFHFGLAPSQLTRNENRYLAVTLPSRIAALTEMLDTMPNEARANSIAASRHSAMDVSILDSGLSDVTPWRGEEASAFRRHLENQLTWPRAVVTAIEPGAHSRSKIGGEPARQNVVLVEVPLSDGHVLLVRTNLDPAWIVDPAALLRKLVSFAAWFTLFIIFAFLLSAMAARRLARPLRELSSAAEQLGGSGDAPPLTPRGPREVQTTIRAFNRMQERLRRFNDDRTRMLAAMSHDLRTPLTRLQLRLEDVEDVGRRQKMLAELQIMAEMVESTLSFARDDTRHEPRSLVDLSALIEGICEDAADAGEPVTFSGPRAVTMSCRPTGIRRTISNLVDNAVKYGGSAAVSLAGEAERIIVTVEDQGPGIPRHEREKVFEPFYRLDRSRNPDTGGVGLGLSVARSIIWEHGGDIILANRQGGGLSVRLELPTGPEVSGPVPSDVGSTVA